MQDLQKLLDSIGLNKHRYRVFDDFVTLSAITLHNQGAYFDDSREQEYLKIIHTYDERDRKAIAECFAKLVNKLNIKPADVLGQLYMTMDLGDANQGQFFTPDHVSRLMSKITLGKAEKLLEHKPFITLSDPAGGAGGMILAFVHDLLGQGYNPAETLWVQAIDISRIASLMCYVQLSLWNVPAQVIVGNSLSLEMRELWHTPAHVQYDWQSRLSSYEKAQKMRDILRSVDAKAEPKETREVLFPKPKQVNADAQPPKTKRDVAEAVQIGFDFN